VKIAIAVAPIMLLAALVASTSAQQPERVIVSVPEAPVFVQPNNTMQPLRMAKQGSSLRVVKIETGWYQVEFQDPQYGRRYGYIERRFVEVPPMPALDLSVPAATGTTAGGATAGGAAAPPRISPGSSPNHTFQKARLSVQVGDKTEAVDVVVTYDAAAIVITDKKTNHALKSLAYSELNGGEYSYAKSPRWKTAIFVSPLFLFTSGKKHWFLAKGKDDYALLHLDKENYRLVLAAFETKTGLKVETVADSK
jgi:hypothetical protein